MPRAALVPGAADGPGTADAPRFRRRGFQRALADVAARGETFARVGTWARG
ncbi:MAG: hypothetical protein K6U14_11485 [Firmicutes bacterium]|nr:hypothetical protein [Alicyclobacillaceae bacterium]MCL6498236.1 hypothetical protein [Bacillota bacterium]